MEGRTSHRRQLFCGFLLFNSHKNCFQERRHLVTCLCWALSPWRIKHKCTQAMIVLHKKRRPRIYMPSAFKTHGSFRVNYEVSVTNVAEKDGHRLVMATEASCLHSLSRQTCNYLFVQEAWEEQKLKLDSSVVQFLSLVFSLSICCWATINHPKPQPFFQQHARVSVYLTM